MASRRAKQIPVGDVGRRLDLALDHLRESLNAAGDELVAPQAHFKDGVLTLERPYVPGRSLEEILAMGPLAPDAALDIAINILRALESAHIMGVAHGDIKPGNIIIHQSTVTLVDFGVEPARGYGHRRVQDIQFLAPEQLGLLDREVTEAADIYSVGLVLYTLLVGEPPFRADDASLLLRQHLNDAPPTLRGQGIHVPGVVDDIMSRMLMKDPYERYQAAAAARRDLEKAAAVHAGSAQAFVVGEEDRRATLTPPAFLNRNRELAMLEQALDAGGLVYLAGESGSGKSRILEEFAQQATLRGRWIVRGQGVAHQAARPFGVLASINEAIRHREDAAPGTMERIAAAIGDEAASVVQALPGMADTLGVEATDGAGPDEHGPGRTLASLVRLLDALGEAGAVVILDDVQWADDASCRLLVEWSQGTPGGLVVAAYRAEEVGQDHVLTRATARVLPLAPFSRKDIEALCTSMAGPLDPQVIETVARLAAGNPFMATAAMHGMVEAGALVYEDGWRIEPDGMAAVTQTSHMAQFLLQRLQRLPEATQDVLAVGAILGKTFEAHEAADLAKVSGHATLEALRHARDRQLLVRDPEGTYTFTHDKIREAVLDRLEEDHRRALHLEAAKQCALAAEQAAFDLAFHYASAGRPDLAYPSAIQAAESARARFSLDIATEYYEIAEQGCPPGEEYRVLEGMGECLMLAGDYEGAKEWLDQARAHAQDAMTQATLDMRLGQLAFRQGDVEEASRLVIRALSTLGHPAPERRWSYIWRLPRELIIQVWHCIRPAQKPRQLDEQALLAVRLYSSLAHINWFMRGPTCCAWTHLKEMNLVENFGETQEMAQAYAEHAVIATTVPWYSRGKTYAERALAIRAKGGDAWGRAQTLHFYAILLMAMGKNRQALDALLEGERIFQRTGDLWQANNAGWHIAKALLRLGRPRDAVQAAKRYYDQADRIGDIQNTGLALEHWVKAGGEVPYEIISKEKERSKASEAQTREAVHQAEGIWLLHNGRPEEAAAAFRAAAKEAKSAALRSDYVSPIRNFEAQCWREAAEALQPWQTKERRRHLRRARGALRRAWSWALRYPCVRPQYYRERGLLALHMGNKSRGERLIAKSIAVAEALDLPYEVTLSKTLGEAQERITTSLVDRFSHVVAAGTRLATATQKSAVHAELIDAAGSIIRGQEVLVTPPGEAPHPSLTNLPSKKAHSCGPTCHGEVADAGYQSALVAPIKVGDEIKGNLWILHKTLEGLYGSEEEQLAEFLCSLAASAIESAQRFDRLRDANRRVSEQAGLLTAQMETMQDGVLVVGLDGQVLASNRRFQEIWGLSPGADVQAKWLDAAKEITQDSNAFVRRIRYLDEHPRESSQDDIHLQDGRVLRRFTAPVLDGGEPVARLWHYQDITDQRRREEQLEASRAHLERLGSLKTDFINAAAHELNTPLTPIKIQFYALEKRWQEDATDADLRALQIVRRNLDRLAGLVKDILDSSRLDSGAFIINPEPTDLKALATDVVNSFNQSAAEKGIELTLEGESVAANVDPSRISQVVTNLISNALRFTPRGAVAVHVDQQGDTARLVVTDSGPGLTQEQQDALFAPFSQPLESPDPRNQGTGLGLHISKGIIDRHGGTIWCQSTPGQGAAFGFAVPLTGPPTDDPKDESPPTSAQAA